MAIAPGHLVTFTEDPASGPWNVISITPPNALLQNLQNTSEMILVATAELSRAFVQAPLPLHSHVRVGNDPDTYELLSSDPYNNVARVAHLQTRVEYTVPLTLLTTESVPTDEPPCKRSRLSQKIN